ncbi:E3 ubiquitin-protein ligase RING1-like [Cardamine amara subsp. amara]|uniref:RING-type E3 ubiquitin transferase n=1 Tax=Cardamine amara subsp. amara TaxID=228776 RepID=A0ABD1AM91_CARAN
MRANIYHRIIRHPQPEDAGTVTFTAMVEGYDSKLTTTSSVEEFIDEENFLCPSKGDLYDFLSESGIDEIDGIHGVTEVMFYVSNVTASSDYSPGCALQVSLFLLRPRRAERVGRTSSANNFVVESFPRKIYDKVSSTDEEECTVCLEEFNNGARVVTLPCQHYFHDECAVKWFETNHVCPLCRFELPCQVQP